MTCKIIMDNKQNDNNMLYFDISDGKACMVRCFFEFTRVANTSQFTIKKDSKLKIKYKTSYERGKVGGEIVAPKDEWFGWLFAAGINKDNSPNKSIRFSSNLNSDVENRLKSNVNFIAEYISNKLIEKLGNDLEKEEYALLNDFIKNISPLKMESKYLTFKGAYIMEVLDKRNTDKNFKELVDNILIHVYNQEFVDNGNNIFFVPHLMNCKNKLKLKFIKCKFDCNSLKETRSNCGFPNDLARLLVKLNWEIDNSGYYCHEFYGQEKLFS